MDGQIIDVRDIKKDQQNILVIYINYKNQNLNESYFMILMNIKGQ